MSTCPPRLRIWRSPIVGIQRCERALRRAVLLLLFVGSFACDRAPQEPQSVPGKEGALAKSTQARTAVVSERSRAPSSNKRGDSELYRFPAAARVVAIGDLHGDFKATKRAFILAGAIDVQDRWVGKKLVVVQTGDQLDRGNDERQILEFLGRLQKEAQEVGGAVVILNGNHESMNVMGDFRYVTSQAMDSFSDYAPVSPLAEKVRPEFRVRAAAFLPGGGAAQVLAQRPIIALVGNTVFVHGGVLPHHVDYGIARLNRESREWMLGESPQPPELLMDPEGPVWTRLYGLPRLGVEACRTLGVTLSKLGALRMVVGHTVQERGLSGACDDRVFRIDVGLSKYYGDRAVQVLEIREDKVRVLTATTP